MKQIRNNISGVDLLIIKLKERRKIPKGHTGLSMGVYSINLEIS